MNINYKMGMQILKTMNLFKNVVITTSVTFIFGIYSIYHLYFYMKLIENKVNKLNKKEIDNQELEKEILKINSNVSKLTDRITELETKNVNINSLCLNKNEFTLEDLGQIAYEK